MSTLEQITENIRRRFERGEVKLPVLPEAVAKISAIAKDPRKGAVDVAKVLADNPTFSLTVLNLANSARFNVSGYEIRSLPVAVQRLGMQRTLQLVIAIASRMYLQVKDARLKDVIYRSSDHALKVATAAQQLAQKMMTAEAEEAFLAGLLHDVGVPTVACAAQHELAKVPPGGQLKIVQMLHRQMGARLLRQWHLPAIFATVALHHGIESQQRPKDVLIDYVDAADCIVQHAGHKVMFDAVTTPPLACAPGQRLGLDKETILTVETHLDEAIAELRQAFNP